MIAYSPRLLNNFKYYTWAVCTAIILAGCMVLAGWKYDIPALKSGIPGLTAMNPGGTALGFIVAGLSLLARTWGTGEPLGKLGRVGALYVLAMGALILFGIETHWEIGIDRMLFREKLDLEALRLGHPNRMAPNTAGCFLLAGSALLLLDVEIRGKYIAQFLALIGLVGALLTIVGYSYSSISLTGVRHYIPMALNTAICFFLLNTAILAARADRGIMEIMSNPGPNGIMARRLMLAVVLVPASFGWLYGSDANQKVISPEMGLALFVLTNMILLTAMVWWTATSLEAAHRAKSEFLANMSHELRTPLNSILGLTRILYEDETLDEEHRDMIGVTYRSAKNLLDTVNDILDLSKAESGKLTLEKLTFSLNEVLDNVAETVLPLSSEKGLVFNTSFSHDNFPYLIGDPMHLGRVLLNLVSNAVKYTEKGSVTLKVDCIPATTPGYVVIDCSVTDTGIGISRDKQAVVFDKFAQADSSITRRFGGTGLGLAITREIVEKMGGQIGLDSEEGKGSRFWFRLTLPTAEVRPLIDKMSFRREAVERLPLEQRKNIADIHLLVAEDHLLNQIYMQKFLPRIGVKKMTIVENGWLAIEALAKEKCDMVLMDCHMPVLSGYDATSEIRTREKTDGGHIPIIAMTADAMPGTRERCLKAGMDDYISKPINQDELRHIMARWLTFPDEAQASAGGSAPANDVVDFSNLREFAQTDDELNSFINIFLTDSQDMIESLRTSDSDPEKWKHAAHKLKGGAAFMGAGKLHLLCEQAQQMTDAPAAERRKIFGKIELEYGQVKQALVRKTSGGD